jgi:hypothetical protein
MKLLLCLDCDDIFNLSFNIKSCQCGATKGKYNDKRNAVYEGVNAFPLAIDNYSFAEAIRNRPQDGLGSRFTACVVPYECPTFVKI